MYISILKIRANFNIVSYKVNLKLMIILRYDIIISVDILTHANLFIVFTTLYKSLIIPIK